MSRFIWISSTKSTFRMLAAGTDAQADRRLEEQHVRERDEDDLEQQPPRAHEDAQGQYHHGQDDAEP